MGNNCWLLKRTRALMFFFHDDTNLMITSIITQNGGRELVTLATTVYDYYRWSGLDCYSKNDCNPG